MPHATKVVFLISLFITVSLFVYPYFKTKEYPYADGNTVIGYPRVAYSFGGGMCAVDRPDGSIGRGSCPPQWMPLENSILDLGFVVGAPLLLAGAVHVLQRRNPAAKKYKRKVFY